MRIFIFASNYNDIGGIQRYTKNLIKDLNSLNQNFKIVMLKKSNLFWKIVFIMESFLKFIFYRPNFILCNHINFIPVAYLYKKLFKVSYGFVSHGIEVWNIKNIIKKRILKNADFIISISKYTATKLVDQFPELKNKIFIIPSTVDYKKFYPKDKSKKILNKYNLTLNDKIILTVSRLNSKEQHKGYDKVIKILPSILKLMPDLKYLIIGDGDDRKRIEKMIEDYNLQENVILTGEISDEEINDYYNLADVFVMPSKGEGFGIVFLEALACGIPVIAGNKDASKEPLLNGELGILIDPDNLEEIKRAIINILTGHASKYLYDKNYLRKRVIENFGLDIFRKKVKMFLESINNLEKPVPHFLGN